jgi:hypothetical protein
LRLFKSKKGTAMKDRTTEGRMTEDWLTRGQIL